MGLTFLKLGGSLITDKRGEASFRPDVMAHLAGEIRTALAADENLHLVIGHGSGSFGHVIASRYSTHRGVSTHEQWRGFSEVAIVAAELNYLVTKELRLAGIPVWKIQPSASALCHDGELIQMALHPLQATIAQGLVPLVYGDVALDEVRGGTIISTEIILAYLAQHLPVERLILVSDVPGVRDTNGTIIPEITPQNYDRYRDALGGAAGTDVTGGMLAKVREMLRLASTKPGLTIRIIDGREPGLLQDTLTGRAQPGTLIHAM
jgi:isopentenyl phosphate kinase